MMKTKQLSLLFLFLLLTSLTFSQLKKIDSIYNRIQDSIKYGTNPIETFKLYDYYSILLENEQKYDESLENYSAIFSYIKENVTGRKYDSLKAILYINKSYLFVTIQKNDSCIANANKAIKICEENNFNKQILSALTNKANALVSKSKFEESIATLINLDKRIEKLKDTVFKGFMKHRNLINIGFNYINMQNWTEAERIFKESLQKRYTNPELRLNSYVNLSSIYLETDKYKLALEKGLKGDSIFKMGNYSPFYKSNLYVNIAAAYENLEQYDKALKYADELLALSEKIKNNEALTNGYLIKGNIYGKTNNNQKAIFYLEKGYELAKQNDRQEYLRDASESLAEVYERSKNYKKALEFKNINEKIRDSLDLTQKNKDVSDALIKYESLKKEQQITQQNLELQTKEATIANQRNTQLLLLAGLGFIVLGGLLFYNRNRAKQKQKLQQAVLEEKEKGFEAVVKASEDERKRISKDLHDGIGQEMAALKMAINHVKEKETDKSQKDALDKIYNNCSKSADEIRNISHQMMPRTLLDSGLVEAIEDLLSSTFTYTSIKYKFEHFNVDERFDEQIEISLYRVAQELITNVVKHSQATEVNVMFYQQNQNLIFFLEDNGIGMKTENKKGHGVLNIKSRIDMIKGSINYEPSPNSGTTATIKIPL